MIETSQKAPANAGGFLNFIKSEPLLHFLGIAALLFVANEIFSADTRELISVDVPTQEYLIQAQEDLLLRPLDETEKQEIIEGFVEEEILTREARKRGFDNSSRIRTMLIQNMRFFMSSEIPTPTEAELRQFFSENPERFISSPSISYDHVFFSDPDTIPEDTISRLRAGEDHRQMGSGDLLAGPALRQVTQRAVAMTFGPEVAREVLAIDNNEWHGPFLSGQGAHFLRVAERHPGRQPSYEDIEDWVATDWQMYRSRLNVDEALTEMRENYIIDIQQSEDTGE